MQINIDGLGKNSQECGFFWREVADHIFEELHLGIRLWGMELAQELLGILSQVPASPRLLATVLDFHL